VAAHVGQGDDCTGAAGELVVRVAIETSQDPDSSSSCSTKLIGRSGWTVEIACL
jgi:hypothetical protein